MPEIRPIVVEEHKFSTSGELRLSNFLLWQLAYAEFVLRRYRH
ncbi:MAG: undecaprenyl diphosphate synthase family protein [Pseudomonadota bacterium]